MFFFFSENNRLPEIWHWANRMGGFTEHCSWFRKC